MPEYQAIMQLLVAKGQVIPRVAQAFLSDFRKREDFTTRLTDSERSVPPLRCVHLPPFPGARLGGLKAPYPSHFKSRSFAGKKELRRPPETRLNRYGFCDLTPTLGIRLQGESKCYCKCPHEPCQALLTEVE